MFSRTLCVQKVSREDVCKVCVDGWTLSRLHTLKDLFPHSAEHSEVNTPSCLHLSRNVSHFPPENGTDVVSPRRSDKYCSGASTASNEAGNDARSFNMRIHSAWGGRLWWWKLAAAFKESSSLRGTKRTKRRHSHADSEVVFSNEATTSCTLISCSLPRGSEALIQIKGF